MTSRSHSRTRQMDSASLFLHFVHDANEFEAQTISYYRYVLQKVAELNDKEGRACLCFGIILIYPLMGYAASFLTSLTYLKFIKNEVVCLLVLFILQVIGYLCYLLLVVHRETISMKKWIIESQQTPDMNFRSDQILEQLAHERRIKVALYAKNLGDVYYAERCSVVSVAVFLVVTFVGSILLLFSQTFWALFWLSFAGSSNLAWGRYKLKETNFGLPQPPEMHREDITKHLVSAQRSWQLAITDGSENQKRTANFINNLEAEGAAFAVYKDGELVVDLWGGFADKDAKRLWQKDILTISFSATKGAASLCIALLVDRGLLDYDKLVYEYWPEFAKNDKKNITVKMLVSHEAGLAVIDSPIKIDDVRDWSVIGGLIENQKPNWPPGRGVGYHVITHGWLIDQLIRRVDLKNRSLSQFFDDEIRNKFDLDFYIGLPLSLNHRVARLKPITWKQWLSNIMDISILKYESKLFLNPQPLQVKAWQNPEFLFENDFANLNNPVIRALEFGSTSGFGTARSLAKIFSLLAERKLIKNETILSLISHPIHAGVEDLVIRLPTTTGWGFFYSQNPKNTTLMGHLGYGGQGVKVDLVNNLSYAYLTNAQKTKLGGFSKTWQSLEKSIFDCFYK